MKNQTSGVYACSMAIPFYEQRTQKTDQQRPSLGENGSENRVCCQIFTTSCKAQGTSPTIFSPADLSLERVKKILTILVPLDCANRFQKAHMVKDLTFCHLYCHMSQDLSGGSVCSSSCPAKQSILPSMPTTGEGKFFLDSSGLPGGLPIQFT